MTARPIDVHALPAMLTALRLPRARRPRGLARRPLPRRPRRDRTRRARHAADPAPPPRSPPAGRQDPGHPRLQGPPQHPARPHRGPRRRGLARNRCQSHRHRQLGRRQDPTKPRRVLWDQDRVARNMGSPAARANAAGARRRPSIPGAGPWTLPARPSSGRDPCRGLYQLVPWTLPATRRQPASCRIKGLRAYPRDLGSRTSSRI